MKTSSERTSWHFIVTGHTGYLIVFPIVSWSKAHQYFMHLGQVLCKPSWSDGNYWLLSATSCYSQHHRVIQHRNWFCGPVPGNQGAYPSSSNLPVFGLYRLQTFLFMYLYKWLLNIVIVHSSTLQYQQYILFILQRCSASWIFKFKFK